MIPSIPGSELEELPADPRLPGLYVVHNAALERLLFDRNLIGVPFRRGCLAASRLFVRHVSDELDFSGDVSELVILSKGLVYQLGAAVGAETGANLPVNLIATTRVQVAETDARVEVRYTCLDAGGSTLLIGDTVASGATIVRAIDEYRRFHDVQRVFVFAYAGTVIGARRILVFCRSIGVEATVLLGLAGFGLGANGFDLSFLHPQTVTRQGYRTRAEAMFGQRQVSAVGWDFGAQSMAPEKYRRLCWVEAYASGLTGDPAFAVADEPDSIRDLERERAAFPPAIAARLREAEVD